MRDMLIIAAVLAVALAVGIALFFRAPAAAPPPGGAASSIQYDALGAASPTPFTVLAHGSTAPAGIGKVNYRITNADQFSALWAMVYGDSSQPPSVDFSSQEVLAAFDGSHATGGYTVAVTSVQDADTRTVTVEHGSAASGCYVAQGQSSPFEIIAVAKTVLSITHVDTTTIEACD